MRQFLITMAGVAAGLVLFAVLVPVILISLAISAANNAGAPEAVPSQAILTLDLRRPLVDQRPATAFGSSGPPSVIDIVDALAAAADDPSVRGAFIRANEFGMRPAHAEEIHQALNAFRDSGRFVVMHAQGFEGPSALSYLAASASDEIWLQASGSFVSTGLAVQTAFFGGMLERFEAEAQFEQFEEFKGGAEAYTRSTYSEPNRQALLSLLEDLFDQAVIQAAEARGVPAETLRAHLEGAPYSAERALELGLVDRLGHVAEAREAAIDRAGENGQLIALDDYLDAAGRPNARGPAIAVVQGQGPILTGQGAATLFRSDAIYGDTFADAIDRAAEDDRVRAIVLRVDSPGGSPAASDQINDAVRRAQENGLPVVASFGAAAASGGYYMSANADEIIAPATAITGSIGVYGGKIVLRDTYRLIDFNVEPLSVGGDFALAYSEATPFTPEQRAAFREMMRDIYEDFIDVVATGREMTPDAVRDVAGGRVWTGAQALERGLIDGIGGYQDALRRAAVLSGLGEDEDFRVIRYPEPLSPFEQLETLFSASAQGLETINQAEALLSSPEVRALLEARAAAQGDISLRTRLPEFQ